MSLEHELQRQISALARRVADLERQEFLLQDWQAPTLLNSWGNYGGEFVPAGYWKDPFGVVHLRGMLAGGTKAAGTALFILPAGYRPTQTESHPAVSSDGITDDYFAEVRVQADGTVVLRTGTFGSGSGWLAINGITFRAA